MLFYLLMALYVICNSIIMGDSNQWNDTSKGRIEEKYKTWTAAGTNELLKLLVDATNRG